MQMRLLLCVWGNNVSSSLLSCSQLFRCCMSCICTQGGGAGTDELRIVTLWDQLNQVHRHLRGACCYTACMLRFLKTRHMSCGL